jgi:hypothetical protein
MTEIANFLSVSNVKSINRIKPNYIENVYEVRTVKRLSCEELIICLNILFIVLNILIFCEADFIIISF